jgi:YidC/Oxa1 family membrane protein insertase
VIHPVAPVEGGLDFQAVPLGTDEEKSRFQISWAAPTLTLDADPAKPVFLRFSNFLGPKSTKLFNDSPSYRRLNYVELVNYGSCGCWGLTSILAPIMMWLLDVLHMVVRNYGIAIMILVAIVRLLMHPLTKKSQVSMSKMSKLQPKIEELKKQYGDKKEELNKAMAEFYRKEGFSPILGCLPMLLQMPIWVALWGGLNASIELRHAPFFWWINDLAAPDCLYQWTTPALGYVVPLLGSMMGPIYSFNLLPLLLMIAMLFQQILTPKPATGPQAGQQKFMMYFMTFFFGLIFYGMPSGLTLYVMASTAVGVGEQYVIKKHIKERDEAEARGELPVKKEKPLPSLRRSSRRRR